MSESRHFSRSESIAALAAALAKAQGQIRAAAKDGFNPHYQKSYADLASIMDACRAPLTSNGLAVMQFPRSTADGVEVETVLAHSSGEWVSESLSLPVMKKDAQGIGSAITYARRYTLAAIVGVAPDEDDDGNAASRPPRKAEANGEPRRMAYTLPAKLLTPEDWETVKANLKKSGASQAQLLERFGVRKPGELPAEALALSQQPFSEWQA